MQVTVYTTPNCPQCEMTKKMLTRGEVRFDVVDLSADEKAMTMVKELGYAAAPVVVAGDNHWSGFRHGLINNLISVIHAKEATKSAAA